MIVPPWPDWAFAIKVAVAALLALYLALWIDLPRPYWAVSTVFITSQPFAGATHSKAVFRVYGTVLGAVGAVVLVPNLVNAPELLAVAIALWVAGCLYFSLLDRTPRSYVLMLAGYTVAFIGFPSVDDPGSIFEVAVSRVEEITLGILCAALVVSTVLPQSLASAIKGRLDQWFRAACGWITAMFGRFGTIEDEARRLRLGSDAIAFDALITPLRYDFSGRGHSAKAMENLRQHMLMFLPIVSSVEDRILALEKMTALPSAIRHNLEEMTAWLKFGTIEPLAADRLRHAVEEADPGLGPRPAWTDLLIASLSARLKDFIDLRQDARLLQRHIVEGTQVNETRLLAYTAKARTIRHRDRGMALLSAVAAFLAVVVASAIWIATGWPHGAAAPLIAAVACSFFAALDDPAPQILGLANASLIGAVGAGIYQFAILPSVTSFEMLATVLAPSMVFCALLMTQPRTALLGLGVPIVGFTLLALQNSYNGDFSSFANGAIAAVAGTWIAIIVTRLVRSVGAVWSARRLRNKNRNSVAEAAFQRNSLDKTELAALMLDRVGLIAARIAVLIPEDAEWTTELLTDVRVGTNLVELREHRSKLSKADAGTVSELIASVGRYFQRDASRPPANLLTSIDACLDRFIADEENVCRCKALIGLTDLRRSLFPNASPYEFEKPFTVEFESCSMTSELDIYGVFVPALFAWMLMAFGISVSASRVLSRLGFYRFVWHRPLFNLAVYVVALGAIVLINIEVSQ